MSLIKEITLFRIDRLLELAENRVKENKIDLAKRYVYIARRLSMHNKVKIPKSKKLFICKKCNNYLIPGITCKVRKSKDFIIYKCNCGNENKMFILH